MGRNKTLDIIRLAGEGFNCRILGINDPAESCGVVGGIYRDFFLLINATNSNRINNGMSIGKINGNRMIANTIHAAENILSSKIPIPEKI